MVWRDDLPKKSLLGGWVGEWVGGDRPNLMLAQVQVFSPGTLDLMDLTWDLTWTGPGPELDNLKHCIDLHIFS